jgi:hypothetical protein
MHQMDMDMKEQTLDLLLFLIIIFSINCNPAQLLLLYNHKTARFVPSTFVDLFSSNWSFIQS